MELMRELSRIQDDEVGLRSETRAMHQRWREQAQSKNLPPDLARKAAQRAAALRKDLDAINDARLGRDGRRALDEAREQLQQLEGEASADPARALQSFEAAQRAADNFGLPQTVLRNADTCGWWHSNPFARSIAVSELHATYLPARYFSH